MFKINLSFPFCVSTACCLQSKSCIFRLFQSKCLKIDLTQSTQGCQLQLRADWLVAWSSSYYGNDYAIKWMESQDIGNLINSVYRKTEFIEKHCFSKNIVFRKTLFFEKHCFSKNKVYRVKNSVYRIEKHCLSAKNIGFR